MALFCYPILTKCKRILATRRPYVMREDPMATVVDVSEIMGTQGFIRHSYQNGRKAHLMLDGGNHPCQCARRSSKSLEREDLVND